MAETCSSSLRHRRLLVLAYLKDHQMHFFSLSFSVTCAKKIKPRLDDSDDDVDDDDDGVLH